VEGCDKSALAGAVKACAAHGGGKRCEEPGCDKSALSGAMRRCAAHGGGRRCEEPGCDKIGVGAERKCKAHGGGRRCEAPGCAKLARLGPHCKAHGAAQARVGSLACVNATPAGRSRPQVC
jgi:hypothetical protein